MYMKHVKDRIRPLLKYVRSDLGKATMLAIGWQVLMALVGNILELSLKHVSHNPLFSLSPHTLLSHTLLWDGSWYLHITEGLYSTSSPSAVFYPLFPFTAWLIHAITLNFVSTAAAGLFVNTVALAFAIYALLKISNFFIPKKYEWWVVILFLASPAAIFLHFFYAEALFCAIGFWAYLAALRRQWLLTGICLALLTATRLPAILFIGLCLLEYARAYDWSLKKLFNRNALSFLLAPVGFICFGIYLWFVRKDFLAMFHGYHDTHDWAYHIFNLNIFQTYSIEIKRIISSLHNHSVIAFDPNLITNHLIPLVTLVILLVSSCYILRALPTNSPKIPLAIFGLVSLFFFSINSNFVSVHRYLLPILIIYIAAIHFFTRKPWRIPLFYALVYTSIIVQTYLYILYVSIYFAG